MSDERWTLHQGDCAEVLKALPGESVSLAVLDPPYHRVVAEDWDREHASLEKLGEWLESVLVEVRRVLKANGSLYLFASALGSHEMARRVQGCGFRLLSSCVWLKDAGWMKKADVNAARVYYPTTERVLFAEPVGAGKGWDKDWQDHDQAVRAEMMQPLIDYLAGEMERAGWTVQLVDAAWQAKRGTKGCMAGHWFTSSQWQLPRPEHYAWLRELFNGPAGGEYLRREYEDLRREYEDRRRAMNLTRERAWTDVWTYPTVQGGERAHVCHKPPAMMADVVLNSSRPNDVVLEPFAGSAELGVQALALGREYVGIERDEKTWARARARLERAANQGDLFQMQEVG